MPQALVDVDEPVNVLWYGEGGSGKTTALATLANLGRLVIVNAESGVKRRALEKLGVAVENIEVFPGEGEELSYDGLEHLILTMREELHKDPDSYAGLAFDSLTEIQQGVKDMTVQAAVERYAARGQERSPWIADQDNWVQTNAQIRKLIRMGRDLPCHFGMSALERRVQDDDGTVMYRPSVTPALLDDLVLWNDVICHTSVELVDGEEEYLGLFRLHGKYRGRDRYHATPKWLVDPWYERVISYVDGSLTRDKDPVMQKARERREAEASKTKKEGE